MNRSNRIEFLEKIEHRILLMDGSMGTYYEQKYTSEFEAEEANLVHPEQIVAIHREYIEAGAQVIRTNTFAVNHELFPQEEKRKQVLRQAVANAKQAVAETGRDVYIAASIGPIRQELAETEEEVREEYETIIETLVEEGIEIFVFETFSDPDRIPMLAECCRKHSADCVVAAQFSVNPMGYTRYGYSMAEIITRMTEAENVDVFGFNCGVGAPHLKKLLAAQVFSGKCLLSALPNAGYQHEIRGRLRYSNDPEYYAAQMEELLSVGVNVIGGCCGTTPAHIAALRELLEKLPEVQQKKCVQGSPQTTEQHTVHCTPFMEKLNAGREKVFVVELDAPFDAQADKFRKGVCALKENGVDIVTVSDSPLARPRADAALLAAHARQCADIAMMPHVAMRDRNLIGLRAEILGAYVNGIRDFLVITGDPVGRDDRGTITGVFDMNSIRFMDYLKHMNEEIFGENPVFYGGALNYAGTNIQAVANRMKKKMEAGCSYFLTQPVFSQKDIARIRDLKELVDAKIICGIMPIVSYRNAMFMQNEMPGIQVDEDVVSRYRQDMSREEAEQVAVELSVGIAEQLYDVADGFYLMTPFHRVGLVNRIIDGIRELGR
ncbi:MAG: bifunctional homocysteine S-methyltransferase/methylenetetrahydrofolate reductase [Roseburia sp.]